MTTTEAVRVLREYIGDREHKPGCSQHLYSDGNCWCMATAHQLPHAALDVLEADHDPTPIDEAWLAKTDWQPIGNTWYPDWNSAPNGVQLYWVNVDGSLRIGGYAIPNASRGQLRTLCRALGVPMKEGA